VAETTGRNAPARAGLRSDRISGLVLIALAVLIGWFNREFPVGTLADPGPGYVPLLLACALGGIGLLVAVSGGRSEAFSAMRWPEATRALIIMVACVAATFALERIGYRLTTAIFLVFFVGIIERKKPLTVVLVAAGFSLASFYVIGDLLKVPLPRGPWGF
jgi:putative tricarboxylic transport membrane protein